MALASFVVALFFCVCFACAAAGAREDGAGAREDGAGAGLTPAAIATSAVRSEPPPLASNAASVSGGDVLLESSSGVAALLRSELADTRRARLGTGPLVGLGARRVAPSLRSTALLGGPLSSLSTRPTPTPRMPSTTTSMLRPPAPTTSLVAPTSVTSMATSPVFVAPPFTSSAQRDRERLELFRPVEMPERERPVSLSSTSSSSSSRPALRYNGMGRAMFGSTHASVTPLAWQVRLLTTSATQLRTDVDRLTGQIEEIRKAVETAPESEEAERDGEQSSSTLDRQPLMDDNVLRRAQLGAFPDSGSSTTTNRVTLRDSGDRSDGRDRGSDSSGSSGSSGNSGNSGNSGSSGSSGSGSRTDAGPAAMAATSTSSSSHGGEERPPRCKSTLLQCVTARITSFAAARLSSTNIVTIITTVGQRAADAAGKFDGTLATLQAIDEGRQVDMSSRLGAFAGTAKFEEGTVGYLLHNSIGRLWLLIGDEGQDHIGDLFNSDEMQAILALPATKANVDAASKLEFKTWKALKPRNSDDTIGQDLALAFDADARTTISLSLFGSTALPYAR